MPARRPSWLPSPSRSAAVGVWLLVRGQKPYSARHTPPRPPPPLPLPEMEDIEDVLGPAGLSGGGAPPGLRLPLAAVAVKPKRRLSRVAQTPTQPEARIPGTQVTPSLAFACGILRHDPCSLARSDAHSVFLCCRCCRRYMSRRSGAHITRQAVFLTIFC